MSYIIVGIVMAGGLAFYLKKRKSLRAGKGSSVDGSKLKADQAKKNAYERLRNMAFSQTPDQLGLALPGDRTTVFGVVMDWEMDGETATTVAFQTGDASLYLTTGGGSIGGGHHESVKSAAKQFVKIAQTYLATAVKTEKQMLPDTHQVNFFLLTNNGTYVGQEQIECLESNSSNWLELFEEGNNVLNELRLTSEAK